MHGDVQRAAWELQFCYYGHNLRFSGSPKSESVKLLTQTSEESRIQLLHACLPDMKRKTNTATCPPADCNGL